MQVSKLALTQVPKKYFTGRTSPKAGFSSSVSIVAKSEVHDRGGFEALAVLSVADEYSLRIDFCCTECSWFASVWS